HDDSDRRGAVVRELSEDKPVLRRALHPGADVGHDRSARPDAIIVASERPEHASAGQRHERSRTRKIIGMSLGVGIAHRTNIPSAAMIAGDFFELTAIWR